MTYSDGGIGDVAETVDEANQMMRLLRRLTTLADATLASAGEVLAEFGLTVSAASLLCALDPRAETPTMRDLSRQMRCDPSTISLMPTSWTGPAWSSGAPTQPTAASARSP
jgi:hypothetical protein